MRGAIFEYFIQNITITKINSKLRFYLKPKKPTTKTNRRTVKCRTKRTRIRHMRPAVAALAVLVINYDFYIATLSICFCLTYIVFKRIL